MGFKLRAACRMHDYAYELMRRGYVENTSFMRKRADRAFRSVAIAGTCGMYHGFKRLRCAILVQDFYIVIRTLGRT